MRVSTESGHASILVLGTCFICFAVAGLAVDGMRVLLERRSLQALADSAARAGASVLDVEQLYRGRSATAGLDPERARSRAAEMLERRPLDRAEIWASTARVLVEVRRTIDPTFLRAIGIRGLPVRASAAAEPVFGELSGAK